LKVGRVEQSHTTRSPPMKALTSILRSFEVTRRWIMDYRYETHCRK